MRAELSAPSPPSPGLRTAQDGSSRGLLDGLEVLFSKERTIRKRVVSVTGPIRSAGGRAFRGFEDEKMSSSEVIENVIYSKAIDVRDFLFFKGYFF